MKSYKERCKHCDRWIQLRHMPGGQWVAFEGYDTVHDCSKPVRKSSGRAGSVATEGSQSDPGFADISIGTNESREAGTSGPPGKDEFVDLEVGRRSEAPKRQSRIGTASVYCRPPASGAPSAKSRPSSGCLIVLVVALGIGAAAIACGGGL